MRRFVTSVVVATAIAAIGLAVALSTSVGHDAADWLISIAGTWAIAVLVIGLAALTGRFRASL